MPETIPAIIRPTIDQAAQRSVAGSLDNLTSTRNLKILAQVDAKNLLKAEKSLGAISRNASEFEKSMEAANARVLAFGTSVAVIEGVRRTFLSLIKTTVDVENALTKIESVSRESLNKAGLTVEQYGQKLFKVARETGQSFETASATALEFARQGQGVAESLKRTRDALILTRLSGLDVNSSVEALTSTYNAFKNEVSDTTQILNKLVAVDNASSASAADLAEGLKRMGFIAKESGQSLDEAIATIATLQEVTARGGAVIGNAFKTILTRAQTLENLQLFESLGVDTTDTEGKIKPIIGLLTELSKIISKPEFTGNQTSILSQLAGNFQINQLSAFKDVLKEVGAGTTIYEKNLKNAANAQNEAIQQNKTYGETLAAGLNTANLAVQELFNNLGQLGVKDPFSALVEKFTGAMDFIKNRIDPESVGSGIASAIVKGIGGILFSNTGLALVGFALIKIVKDFVVFAKEAATGFLSFNKTSREQERIQSSIANILATERGILDGIANTEQGRVILAQRVNALYESRLNTAAALHQLEKGAAQIVHSQGTRISQKGEISIKGRRSAEGYLPSLVRDEMRDVKNGVGGANPNSKILIMPNFPFGGGKRGLMVANSSEKMLKVGDGYAVLNPNQAGERGADGFLSGGIRRKSGVSGGGQFIETSILENAISLMANDAILSGKSMKELAAIINKTIGGFELNRETFARVSSEANKWAANLHKQNQLANANLVAGFNPMAAFGAGQSLAAQYKKSDGNPLALSRANVSFPNREINNQLGRYEPIRNRGLIGSDSLTKAIQIGTERAFQKSITEYRGLSIAPKVVSSATIRQNYLNNPTAAFGASQRINNENYSPSSVILPQKETQELKKNFSDISGKLFFAGVAAEGLGSALGDSNNKLVQFAEFLGKAGLGLYAISQFSEVGGFKSFDFGRGGKGKFGAVRANLSRGFTAGKTGEALEAGAGLAAGAGRLLGGALRIVPVIGQVAIGLGILNEGLKLFKIDLFEGVRLAFRGLTESAEKTKETFREFSLSLFNKEGKLVGVSRVEAIQTLSSERSKAIQNLEAKSLGIDTEGKEAGPAILRKKIEDALSKIKTGNISERGGFSDDVIIDIETVLSQVTESTKENLIAGMIALVSGTSEEIRLELEKLGTKTIDGKLLKEVSDDSVREELINSFFKKTQKLVPGQSVNFESLYGGQEGLIKLFADIQKQISPQSIPSVAKGSPKDNITLSQAKNQADILFEEKNLTLAVVSEREKQIKIEQQIGEISAKRNAQLDGETKRLELQRNIQRENLTLAQETFNAALKEAATTRKDGIPKADQEAALKIRDSASNLSQEELVAKLVEMRKLLTGAETNSKDKEAIETSIKLLSIQQKSKKESLDLELDITKAIVDGTEAIRERNRLLEISRELAEAKFESGDISKQREISRLQNISGRINTSEAQRRGIQGEINSAEVQRLQSQIERNNARFVEQRDALSAETISTGSFDQYTKGVEKLELETSNANQKLQDQITELERLSSQLQETESSTTSFANSLDQFVRGLGSQRGQNQFNLLQSTDPSSIAQGLIGEQVYGSTGNRQGAELVSFISQQNALLTEQFKIKTAASATEKLELERTLELTKEIIAIRNSGLDPIREQEQIEAAINANLEKRRTFGAGVDDARAGIQDRIQNFNADFGKTAVDGFRDGLSSAIKAAVSETDNLKGALLDVALQFANSLRDKAIDNLSDVITNNLFKGGGSSGGGFISGILGLFGGGKAKGYATGGLITGGSGNKDDVPTLLMGGEYVMPKDIVSQYGKSFFDRLRDGSVGKMAQGGYFAPGVRGQGTISGKENLLDFATQTATSGKGDVISSLAGGAGLVSLEPESLRLSNFARFGDSPIGNATQEAKEQAFGLYLDQLGQEKEYARQLEEIRSAEQKRKKDQKKQFLMSLATAVIGAGLSYGLGGGAAAGASKAGSSAVSGGSQRYYDLATGSLKTSGSSSGGGNLLSRIFGGVSKTISGSGSFRATAYGNADIDPTTAADQMKANAGIKGYNGFSQTVGSSGRSLVPGYSVASNFFKMGTVLKVNGQLYRVDDTGGMSKNIIDFYAGSNKKMYNDFARMGNIQVVPYGRNSGGYGAGAGDTNPAMLSNKEFVLNSAAAQKIGDKGLYALNNGMSPSSSGDMEAKIVAKLDELINKTIGASNVNVTVNMGGEAGENKQDKQDGGDQNNQRQLAQRIKETVVNVIREEQRPGGLLTSTRR